MRRRSHESPSLRLLRSGAGSSANKQRNLFELAGLLVKRLATGLATWGAPPGDFFAAH